MSSSPGAFLLLHDYAGEGNQLPMEDVLVHLGSQVAANLDLHSSILTVRLTSPSAIAVLGHLQKEDRGRFEALSAQLQLAVRRFRYVDYAQAEKDSEAIARKLRQRLGTDFLSEAQFVGIPRGGLIVLGMLSYTLDLAHPQLEKSALADGPVVVVDDCALTGLRFRKFLRQWPNREIVFAPLYAHPELCTAIERDEPQVMACVNARDLHDYGPNDLGDNHEDWQTRWHECFSGEAYWIGRTERLGFSWGEVNTIVWNSDREEVEQGLSVIPPEHRLKTRPGTDVSHQEVSNSVQIQPHPAGPIGPAAPVLFGQVDDHTIVANPDADICVELDGTAAAMWHALVEHGTVDDTVDDLCQTYSVEEATLRADLVGFIDRLAAHDLLHVPDGSLA